MVGRRGSKPARGAVRQGDRVVALLAAVALVAAVVQASTGLGFALVLGPAVFALLDPEPAIVAITVLGLALNGLVLFAERRRPVVAWEEVGPILAAAAPGAVCGVFVLRALPKSWLQIAVGAAVIGAAVLRVRARRDAAAPTPGDPRARLALGFATGTLTTSAGVNGPPIALWLTHRGLGPAEVRDSLSATFLGLGVIGGVVLAPVLAVAGTDVDWTALGVALACVVAGHAVGKRIFARIDAARYEPVLLVLVTAAGVASVAAGLAAV
jgi:uncharacterized membrane protein YfcA